MCVAVVVETKTGPSALEMWQMDDNNPHGVGVAWCSGDLVRYKKGLDWKAAYELLQRIPRPALLHFRWATHGGKSRHLTHPFPLGPRALTSRKLNGAAKAVLIHNGVWQNYLLHAPNNINLDKWSDTAVAAYAAGTIGEDILDDVDWSTAVARASGEGRIDITMRGHWTEHNGNMYSNLQWIPYSQRKSTFRWDGSESSESLTDNYGTRCDWAYPGNAHGGVVDTRPMKIVPAGNKSAFDEWLEEYEQSQKTIEAQIKSDAVTIRPIDEAIDQLALKLGGKGG